MDIPRAGVVRIVWKPETGYPAGDYLILTASSRSTRRLFAPYTRPSGAVGGIGIRPGGDVIKADEAAIDSLEVLDPR